LPGLLTDLSSWVGFCTSRPQLGVKYQLWYLKKELWSGISINISWQIYYGRKVLAHLGPKSNVLPGLLTDLSAWVDFYTSISQQGVKYQLWYLKCFWWRVDLYKYPMTNILRRQSSCPLGIYVSDIAQAFNWLKFLGGFLHLKPRAGCQISNLIFDKNNCGGGYL
jgi:hypothetical protein